MGGRFANSRIDKDLNVILHGCVDYVAALLLFDGLCFLGFPAVGEVRSVIFTKLHQTYHQFTCSAVEDVITRETPFLYPQSVTANTPQAPFITLIQLWRSLASALTTSIPLAARAFAAAESGFRETARMLNWGSFCR